MKLKISPLLSDIKHLLVKEENKYCRIYKKGSYVTNQIVTDKINFDKYIISTKCDDETSKFITLDIETQGNNHLQEVSYVSAYKGYGIGKVFTGYKVWVAFGK